MLIESMRLGDRVADRFVLERLAGEGGMGIVYRALDTTTGKAVALKVVHNAEASADRFRREAAALAELEHPGIVKYVAHGEVLGKAYLAMEWLDGEDLDDRLASGPIGIDGALRVGRRVAEALAAAHARGIIHRDIKPANLFLRGGSLDDVVVVDFGIARVARASTVLTATGAFVGTPSYMAPEQVRGDRAVDARADIYSLGCVLFQCVMGRAPFVGEHMIAVLAKILFEDAPPLDGPAPLASVVARMLAKDPAARLTDCAAVLAELDRARDGDAAPAPSLRKPASVITTGERKLLCVVMGVPPKPAPDFVLDPTLASLEVSHVEERLQSLVDTFGARVQMLADASFVVTLSATGPATDLAARAARCALALQAQWQGPVALATGLGEVTGTLPIGDIIDRAARRLHSVRKASGTAYRDGHVLLDDVTPGLLDARFELEADAGGGLSLKRERTLVTPTARTLLGRPTPCIGRDRELAMLDGFIEDCTLEREARVVLVTAPPGVGKSRLLTELVRRVQEKKQPIQIWLARADTMSAGAPFGLLAQIVRQVAGILEGEPADVRHQRLRARVARALPGERAVRVADFLGTLVGASRLDRQSEELIAARADPMLMADEIRSAATELLAAEAARQPIMLLLEDLHWGDLPTVRFVDHALRTMKDAPILVIALARPEVHEVFPRLWEERGAQEIRLGALGKRAAERLVRDVLGEKATDTIVERLVDLGGGNAFYLEELIRSVAEGREGHLPETVLAMAQTRLEALTAEARRALRAASVFGEVFWRAGLGALLGDDQRQIDVLLTGLVEREVIARSEALKFPNEHTYTFRHALLRDAAYASLTARDLAQGHRRAGEWLAAAGETDAATLAEHFERGEEPERALLYYARAVEQALAANDFRVLLARSERALRLEPPPEAKRRLHAHRGRALSALGSWNEARVEHETVLALAPPDNDELRAEQHVELARCAFWSLDIPETTRHADEALVLAERVKRTDLEAEALGYTALTRHAQEDGDLDLALACYRSATARANDRYFVSAAVSTIILYWLGHLDECAWRTIDIADEARRRNDLWGLMQALPCAGLSLAARGRYREAQQLFAEARRIGQKHEIKTLLARAISMSAGFHQAIFDVRGARRCADEATEIARSAGFTPAEASSGIDLLFDAAREGDVGGADALLPRVRSLVEVSSGWHGWLWKMRFAAARAEIALARRAWDEARIAAEEAIAKSRRMHRSKYEAVGLAARARALHGLGRTNEAIDDSKKALAVAQRSMDTGIVLRAFAQLIALSGDDAPLAEAHATIERIDKALPSVELRRAFRAADPVRLLHPELSSAVVVD
jgi:eukaryotic-like serine/threonine-protein kinase